MASTADDPNKPVTGYPPPPGYQPDPAHPSHNLNGFSQAQPSHNLNGFSQAQPGHSYYAATGTAYAYAAPPPPHPSYYNPNPYPMHDQTYYARRSTFLRRLIIAGIAALLIVGAITFILWLVLRPHLPVVRVESATLSNFNASGSYVSGDWDVTLFFRNPNKKIKVYYDRLDASVFYGSELLADTALAPFYQEKKNETRVKASFTTRSEYVADKVVRVLVDDRSRGAVTFNLRMLVAVRFKAGAWRTRRHLMRVYCGDVKIGLSQNRGAGSLIGGAKECEVDL